MVHVPYKGTAPALADLVSGSIQVVLEVPIGVMSQIKAGKIRGLAILAKERVPAIADIPTIEQSGGRALEASSWSVFVGPANTPQPIVDRISEAAMSALKDKDLQARFIEQAAMPIGTSPAEAEQFFRRRFLAGKR